MSSPAPSDISQNDAEVLEKQQQEMQQRHEEQQQLLAQLEEAVKLHWAEHTAQKAKKKVEEKAQEEAKRQRVIEEEKRKKRIVEYLQQLWDKVLEEEAALLKGAEGSQVVGSKRKEVAAGDEKRQRPSKKARGRYHRGAAVKMGALTPARGVCALGRIAWCTPQGEYLTIILIIIF